MENKTFKKQSDFSNNDIKERLKDLNEEHFGYSAFGLKYTTKRALKEYIISYKNKIADTI